MYCIHCGNRLNAPAKFCPKCGAKLDYRQPGSQSQKADAPSQQSSFPPQTSRISQDPAVQSSYTNSMPQDPAVQSSYTNSMPQDLAVQSSCTNSMPQDPAVQSSCTNSPSQDPSIQSSPAARLSQDPALQPSQTKSPLRDPVSRKKSNRKFWEKHSRLSVFLLAVALILAVSALFFLIFHKLPGEKDSSEAVEDEYLEGNEEIQEGESELAALSASILEESVVSGISASDGTARGTVELPAYGEYLLQAYEALKENPDANEDTALPLFTAELQKLLSKDELPHKSLSVSVPVSEIAASIVTSADYLEDHELTDPEAYTPTEEEMMEALKQAAREQEIRWFEDQLWTEAPISDKDLIPSILQEENS